MPSLINRTVPGVAGVSSRTSVAQRGRSGAGQVEPPHRGDRGGGELRLVGGEGFSWKKSPNQTNATREGFEFGLGVKCRLERVCFIIGIGQSAAKVRRHGVCKPRWWRGQPGATSQSGDLLRVTCARVGAVRQVLSGVSRRGQWPKALAPRSWPGCGTESESLLDKPARACHVCTCKSGDLALLSTQGGLTCRRGRKGVGRREVFG